MNHVKVLDGRYERIVQMLGCNVGRQDSASGTAFCTDLHEQQAIGTKSVSLPVNALLLLADMTLIQNVGDCPSTKGQEETSHSRKQQCGLMST